MGSNFEAEKKGDAKPSSKVVSLSSATGLDVCNNTAARRKDTQEHSLIVSLAIFEWFDLATTQCSENRCHRDLKDI